MMPTTPHRRAWRTIRKMLFLAGIPLIAQPGSAGRLSLDALAMRDGPARQLVQAVLGALGQGDAAQEDLRGDLQQTLGLAEGVESQAQQAEAAIAREDPFQPIPGSDGQEHPSLVPGGSRYVSPGDPTVARAARALRAAL